MSDGSIGGMIRSNWNLPLPRAVAVADGTILMTLEVARTFLLDQPEHHQWRVASAKLIAAAATSNPLDVEEATRALEDALILAV